MDNEKDEEEDRLSNLPEALLVSILSALPTKQAVSISILSKRYRYLWHFITQLQLLDQNIFPTSDDDDRSAAQIWHTMLDSIELYLHGPIHSCTISFNPSRKSLRLQSFGETIFGCIRKALSDRLPMGIRCEVSEPVIFDILLYLPVKSLLRFKTVCKSWCSIIESTGFANQHLYHNSEKNNAIVSSYCRQLCMIKARECELCLNLDFECMFPRDKLRGLSSCNGIVCLGFLLSKYIWRVCLWNPATKQARELPEASYLRCQPSDETFAFHIFSIGFDKKTNDYKIISMSVECLIRSVEYTGPDVVRGSLVQVYSMRNDSWRTIHEGDEFPVACFHEDKLLCNGEICLCIVNTPDSIVNAPDGTTALFYFDVVDEVYGVVPLPKYPLDAYCNSPAFLNGKIGYIEWIPELSHDKVLLASSYYEIWVMNEFGVKESWYKVCRFEDTLLPCNFTGPLYLSKNGDFILSSKKCETDCELYLYDLVTGEVKCVGAQNVDRITNYSESLVSVKSNSDVGPVYV